MRTIEGLEGLGRQGQDCRPKVVATVSVVALRQCLLLGDEDGRRVIVVEGGREVNVHRTRSSAPGLGDRTLADAGSTLGRGVTGF